MDIQTKTDIIHQKIYDFLLYIYPLLTKYPKYEKFSLQTATRNAILEMLQEVIKWDKTATKKMCIRDRDNLKLGYGGTKEEMQRLLDDASKLSGIKYDISSYSDIVDAIHVVQTEMDITGTTAKEASTTIEGSVSSMSSAWDNWVAGMADSEANFSQLTSNLVDSIVTVVGNIAPRVIETVPRLVSGLGEIVEQLATDRKSTRLNSSHITRSRMPSSA